MDLEKCFDELVKRLMKEDRDLCRVELLAWFDHLLRRHRRRYKLLYRQLRKLLNQKKRKNHSMQLLSQLE